jgi:hypothetical protein
MADVEDGYLGLVDAMLARSEYAAAERGVRNDIDSVNWAVAAIGSGLGVVAGGMLSAWGERLADEVNARLQRMAKRGAAEADHATNVDSLSTLHRIVVEVRQTGGRLPPTIESRLIAELASSGIDAAAARALAARIVAIVEQGQADA